MKRDHYAHRYDTNRAQKPVSANGEYRAGRRAGSWRLAFVLVLLWSALIGLGYTGLEALLVWLSASGDSLAQAGKSVGTAFGVGKEVGAIADSLQSGGLWEQAIAVLHFVLKPAVAVIWLLGALVLIILPRLLGRLAGVVTSKTKAW